MWINSSRCKRSPAGLDDAIISTIAALDRSIRMDNSTDSAAENCHKIMGHRSDSRYRESNSTANLRITSHHVSVSWWVNGYLTLTPGWKEQHNTVRFLSLYTCSCISVTMRKSFTIVCTGCMDPFLLHMDLKWTNECFIFMSSAWSIPAGIIQTRYLTTDQTFPTFRHVNTPSPDRTIPQHKQHPTADISCPHTTLYNILQDISHTK